MNSIHNFSGICKIKFLFLIFPVIVLGQLSGWQNLSPSPPYSTFEDVFFLNADTGWAVADYGIIIKTVDGGSNWTQQSSGTANHLFSVFFIDKETGWASGDQGVILNTIDGGTTWSQQSSGSTNRLYDVVFIDSQKGWAVGSGGDILHTSDGGAKWSAQTSNTTNWLLSVSFVSPFRGWAVGYFGTIVHTTDGGKNWKVQNSNVATFLTSVQFRSWYRGWVIGTGGTVLKTGDGGETWNQVNSGISEDLYSAHFPDRFTGWCVGTNGAIYHTVDGGENWFSQMSSVAEILFSVHSIHPDTAWAVGGNGTILKTTNGGELENKIYGFVQNGITPIENIKINLWKIEDHWTNYNKNYSSNTGYYDFNNLNDGEYRLYPSLYNTDFWNYNFINGSSKIVLEDNDLVCRNIRLYKKIDLMHPDKELEKLPLQIEWEALAGADHYRIFLIKQGISYKNWFYNSDIINVTSHIVDDVSESGYIHLYIKAYDSDNQLVAYNRKSFYLFNNSSIVSGSIINNTVWEGFIFVKGDITINSGVSLTIKPGTTVFFDTLDTGGAIGRFGINNQGTIIANGTSKKSIDFTSYSTKWNADKMNWNGINIYNDHTNNSFKYTRFHEAGLALDIVNSNVTVNNSRFYKNGAALNVDASDTNFERCYFSSYRAKDSYIKIQNNANPLFLECNFANSYGNGNYFIELLNTSNDITAGNCYWYYEDRIDSKIFDKKDDSSLGEFIYQPKLSDYVNISIGAENVSLQNNKNIEKNTTSETDDIHNVLGEPDQKDYFLNTENSIILDMGLGGEIVNGDSSDITIFARNYKSQDTSIVLVDVSVSNDTTKNWESIGLIQDISSFDISQLNYDKYRYVKISNYSSLPMPSDSIGCYIDAVVTIHDSLLATVIPEPSVKQKSGSFFLYQNYPNPFNPSTNIDFFISKNSNVKIKIYNLLGQVVETLMDTNKAAGKYSIKWVAQNKASGIYYYQIITDDFVQIKKMLLLK